MADVRLKIMPNASTLAGSPGRVWRTRIEEGREVGSEARELIAQIVLAARVAAGDFRREPGEFRGIGERGQQRGVEFGHEGENVGVGGTSVNTHDGAVILNLACVAC